MILRLKKNILILPVQVVSSVIHWVGYPAEAYFTGFGCCSQQLAQMVMVFFPGQMDPIYRVLGSFFICLV
jgi:hypothetical protein